MQKHCRLDYNILMTWVRNILGGIFLLILLSSLVGTAVSTSGYINLAKPYNLEIWLANSSLYQSFLTTASNEAEKAATTNTGLSSASLSSVVVQQAASSAFSESTFEQYVNTVINSNYAWLQGTTAKPNFSIDLNSSKSNFASQIGVYVDEHLSALPVCTPPELAALGNTSSIDPLSLNCRPASLNIQAEGTMVAQQISSSSNFLSNSVITADNLSPKGQNNGKPYYQKYSELPKIYRFMVKLPLLYGGVSILSAICAYFLITKKRKALRSISIVLIIAGLILIGLRLAVDKALTVVEKKIFNQSNIGQLQQSLIKFLGEAAHELTKPFLWFGGGYILAAILILIMLVVMKNRKRSKPKLEPVTETPPPSDIATRLRISENQIEPPERPIKQQIPVFKKPASRSNLPKKKPPNKLIQ